MPEDDDEEKDGYWCVICGRLIPIIDGVAVHDDVEHPENMLFNEDEVMH